MIVPDVPNLPIEDC